MATWFMKELRQQTSRMKEGIWLMGEVIHGDYGRWVNHETLHSVTNYELHKGLYSGHTVNGVWRANVPNTVMTH